jgi:hypothetical protein
MPSARRWVFLKTRTVPDGVLPATFCRCACGKRSSSIFWMRSLLAAGLFLENSRRVRPNPAPHAPFYPILSFPGAVLRDQCPEHSPQAARIVDPAATFSGAGSHCTNRCQPNTHGALDQSASDRSVRPATHPRTGGHVMRVGPHEFSADVSPSSVDLPVAVHSVFLRHVVRVLPGCRPPAERGVHSHGQPGGMDAGLPRQSGH